jgi:hypothetical protein
MDGLFGISDAVTGARHVLCPLGRHRGARLGWIMDHDPGYFAWMVKNVRFDTPRVREAVRVLELAHAESLERAANNEAMLRR